MADEISPTTFALLFSAFGVVGAGLVIYAIDLPIDILNTVGGALGAAVLIGAVEFVIVKRAISQTELQ